MAIFTIPGISFAQEKENMISIVKEATEAKLVSNLKEANIDAQSHFQLSQFDFTNTKTLTVAEQEQLTITYSFLQTITKAFGSQKKGDVKQFNDWTVKLAKNEDNRWEVVKCGFY